MHGSQWPAHRRPVLRLRPLTDGRRVKTASSTNNAYCDRLYQEWIRERTT